MAEVNSEGFTACVYFMPIDKLIELGSGHAYFFKVDRNISLSWVKPEDLDAVLDVRGGCCGNKIAKIVRLASSSDLRLWSHTADR